MDGFKILTAYAEAGMCLNEAARATYYSRKTYRYKLIQAGREAGINPFNFFELAHYLLERKGTDD